MIEHLQIKPIVSMILLLDEIAAHQRLESGGEGVGRKIVVQVP
ncbi:hypothetical protein [Umezakia ovalisporum]|uniref:Uncharacterized protein n=2 Tax=Umezakia ovalisporum TaxID=75695 RepID=A0AA43GW92_9CYAN|nr:hypothetical protein [Umezakia ovalisporum]MDH6057558.1 hypothetical protein [Umezakia ovalisporum FSS-43]MDH6062826.1 hypothetical protein [Umezakia ovalisporum FSS-62]MDH6069088.1 hypothetical protein [Umezakia ovalisporum APH033B]MDH6070726.1 hypothetical protein [Umezakia ovalisporum CobakiLakeA]MDH6073905.1 hypothetical protein [Umezakia ovalisporum CS-1034]